MFKRAFICIGCITCCVRVIYDNYHWPFYKLPDQTTITNDETSPLKFGKLQKLTIQNTAITAKGAELISPNLFELIHLVLLNSNLTEAALLGFIQTELEDPLPISVV